MKKNTTIIIILLFSLVSYAQKGYVEYGYVESLKIGGAKGLDYNAVLLFDKNYSNYITAKESFEAIEKITESKIVKNEDGEVEAVFNGNGLTEKGDWVYFSNKDKKMLSILHFQKREIAVNDGAVQINWKITTETKKIGAFFCTKATAKFRGRNYIAWFTTEVPVTFGPWKLNGLPGLILEAYDESKFVYWYFKNIEYPSTKTEKITPISAIDTSNFVSYANFLKLQQEELQKIEEKNAMIGKDFPGIKITNPKIIQLFVEFE